MVSLKDRLRSMEGIILNCSVKHVFLTPIAVLLLLVFSDSKSSVSFPVWNGCKHKESDLTGVQ